MTPALLRAAGEAMYGLRWRAPLSRDLGVAKRTVERWEAGTVPCPADLWERIRPLLTERRRVITELLR